MFLILDKAKYTFELSSFMRNGHLTDKIRPLN